MVEIQCEQVARSDEQEPVLVGTEHDVQPENPYSALEIADVARGLVGSDEPIEFGPGGLVLHGNEEEFPFARLARKSERKEQVFVRNLGPLGREDELRSQANGSERGSEWGDALLTRLLVVDHEPAFDHVTSICGLR